MTTPPDTRPASSDPADIAAWEDRQERIRDERKFREEMRQFAGRVDATLTSIQGGMAEHAREDKEQFRIGARRMTKIERKLGATNSVVMGNSNRWAVLATATGIVGSLIAGAWVVFDKVLPLVMKQ